MDPKKIKWPSMRAKFFNSPRSLFTQRFDFGGVRIVLYSLRAPFTFDDEPSWKFVVTAFKR